MMGNDYVWFGRSLELGGHSFENDLIAAGQIVNISDCTLAGSIRGAAQKIRITNTAAKENITVAAQDVVISNGNANAILAAGSAVSFSGSCKELTAYAGNVVIDGTVEGDVVVGAGNVTVGSNARIKGTLHVKASSEPVMQRGAEVGSVDFSQAKGDSAKGDSAKDDSTANDFATGDIAAEIDEAVSALTQMLTIIGIIIGIFGTLIVAVLAEWLFRRHTAAAAEMIRTRTGATIGTGIIGAIAAPIAIIILFCLVITIPAAAGLTLALLAMSCVAGGFAGASLFRIAFPRLGRYKCALAGGAIVGVAGAIPVLGQIVSTVAFMYLLGYVLQTIYLGIRKPKPSAPTAMAPTPGAPVNGYPAAAAAPVTAAATAPVAAAAAAPVAPGAPEESPAPADVPESEADPEIPQDDPVPADAQENEDATVVPEESPTPTDAPENE